MRTSLQPALNHVCAFEGGYVNHPSDPGGCTNRGITLATYRQHIKANGTCRDLKDLTWEQAAEVYRKTYWSAVNADALPVGLDLLVFDHGVNAGPGRAARILQREVGATRDGQIGPGTLAAIASYDPDPHKVIERYAIARMSYYRSLRTWNTFGRGWARRAEAARVLAHELCDKEGSAS